MTTETTGWNAGDHIENFVEAAAYLQIGLGGTEGRLNEKMFVAILTDIANSKWMQQRAKDGKTVVLAGKA